MVVLVVTLVICTILGISYVFFSKAAKKRKVVECERNALLHNFYKQEMMHIGTLRLEGIGNDGNSDFEFGQAVRKINLSNDTRVQIYD